MLYPAGIHKLILAEVFQCIGLSVSVFFQSCMPTRQNFKIFTGVLQDHCVEKTFQNRPKQKYAPQNTPNYADFDGLY
jgi:hypothetical protein